MVQQSSRLPVDDSADESGLSTVQVAERVAIQAVCAEASSFTDEQIAALTQAWHVDLPIVRDLQALGRDLFQVPWAPTLVVLDGKNVVQIYRGRCQSESGGRTAAGAGTVAGR